MQNIKLLSQLRLLNPSLPITLIPPTTSSVAAARSINPIFLSNGFRFTPPLKFASRRHLSVRPFRAAAGSSFSRGSSKASKSLIDDEAELSDWVGDLRTSSIRGRLTSDEDSDSDRGRGGGARGRGGGARGRGGVRGRGRGDGGGRGRGMGDGGEGAPPRRTSGRGGSSENGRGRGRGGVDSGFRKDVVKKSSIGKRSLLGSDEDSVDEDDDDEEAPIRGFDHLLGEDDSDDVDDTEDDEDDDEDDSVYKNHASSSLGLEKKYEAKVIPSSTGSSTASSTASSFDQCSVSPLTLKAIKDAGYENMTVVQAATLPVILKGKDVLAKARTGTGKTVAFLLPSIEVIVKTPPADHDNKRPPILVLVICPTRELALQAAAEANKLLKYHPSLGVQCVIGGTRLALEQKKLQANPCQILVATPGRLRDHLENTAGFATKVKGVKVLVLDEADRLLDMGFRKDIDKIIAAVSKERQTLLFSATVPPEVRQMCHVALKRDHEYINTVEEGSEETHAKVSQMHMVAPLQKHFPLLYALLRDHIADNVDYKVLVFCTTAMVTRLVADCLGELKLNIREIHSRKSQSYRSKVSDEFRNSKGLILVTSDVSARGVDYPDVTLVVQVGIPSDREQYIHRLGRTGRKGKEGQGVLLLAPWEEFFLSTVKDLPISKADVPTIDPDTTKKVERALSNVEMKSKESAYQAWLGYYNSDKKIGKDKFKLVELANEFSRSMGLDNPPAIPKITLGKMGLKNIPGLRSK
ncbi:DEAD-box ATP-dependent RNA helicase 31 [Linum perenne]